MTSIESLPIELILEILEWCPDFNTYRNAIIASKWMHDCAQTTTGRTRILRNIAERIFDPLEIDLLNMRRPGGLGQCALRMQQISMRGKEDYGSFPDESLNENKSVFGRVEIERILRDREWLGDYLDRCMDEPTLKHLTSSKSFPVDHLPRCLSSQEDDATSSLPTQKQGSKDSGTLDLRSGGIGKVEVLRALYHIVLGLQHFHFAVPETFARKESNGNWDPPLAGAIIDRLPTYYDFTSFSRLSPRELYVIRMVWELHQWPQLSTPPRIFFPLRVWKWGFGHGAPQYISIYIGAQERATGKWQNGESILPWIEEGKLLGPNAATQEHFEKCDFKRIKIKTLSSTNDDDSGYMKDALVCLTNLRFFRLTYDDFESA